MNRLPQPEKQSGGKGSKDDKTDTTLGSRKDQQAKDDRLLDRARRRFDDCMSRESENRKEGLTDDKFLAGQQWPADIQAQRNVDQRPCLTINKLPTFVSQVTNNQRLDRPTINVSPIGDRADVQRHRCCQPDHGEVPVAARDLLERGPGARSGGQEPHLGEQLVGTA